MTYHFSKTLPFGMDDAIARDTEELKKEGFGILTEIDVAATLKTKLDLDLAPYLILGACNPPLAHQAISIDPSIGVLLPCNVVVRTLDETHTLVEAMDPDVMVNATGNPALASVAEQARTRLSAALAALTE